MKLLIAHALAIMFIYTTAKVDNFNQSQFITTHVIQTDYFVLEISKTQQVVFKPRPNVDYNLATTFTPNTLHSSDYKSATK